MSQTHFSQSLKNSAVIQAIAAVLVALIAIAFVPILLKFSEQELSPTATVFHRFWLATVILGGWNGLSKLCNRSAETVRKPMTGEMMKLLGLMGLFSTLTHLFWTISLTQTTVANSALMHNLSPLLTILGARLFFQQQFNVQFIIGAIAALGGVLFLGWEDFALSSGKFQGDAIALLSAFFFAGYLLAIEKLSLSLPVKSILLWRFFLNSLFLFPFLWWSEALLFPSSERGWLVILTLALIAILGESLVTFSLKQLSSGLVSILFMLDPVFASVFAWFIFSESLPFTDILAFAVIVGGISLAIAGKSGIKTVDSNP
ncbi:MAG: DMT family transporter [Cyanobacteria bacterium P01_E01_bin.42]